MSAAILGILVPMLLACALPTSAQTISLSGTSSTLPFREYATRELNDPWDMSQRTDLGWFTWSVDSPPSNLTSKSIATDAKGNTYFSARLAAGATTPSLFLLDTWVPGTAKLGKVGANHPIDTSVYNVLYVKMKIGSDVLNATPRAQISWSRNTIYTLAGPDGGAIMVNPAGPYLTPMTSQPFGHLEGGQWVIYRIPLTIAEMKAQNGSTDITSWFNANGGAPADWGAAGVTADSLRLQPFSLSPSQAGEIQVDWARLVSYQAGSATTVNWTGGGAYDVVVSMQADCSDFSVLAYSASSGFQFQSQVLPPGTYRVGLRRPFTSSGQTAATGATLAACSSATLTVQSYPTLTLSSPDPEGSADDFATTILGNAWDFDSLNDIDWASKVNYPDSTFGIVSMPATDAAGNDLGSVRVYRNQSTDAGTAVGDPYIYPLWLIPMPGANARGRDNPIDANRYRILTTEAGVERSRDLSLGSIARFVWHVAGDVKPAGTTTIYQTVSADICLRHLPPSENGGKIVLDKIQLDMADRSTLPLESDFPQSASGWSNTCTASGVSGCNTSDPGYKPGVNIFRFDFHEFSAATNSEVRRIKLAALEHTGSSFQIRWTPSNPSSLSTTVTLKAVPEVNPAGGNYRPVGCSSASSVTIATGVSLASGSYTWTPSGFARGTEYYVCAQLFVAGVSGAVDEVMSLWPVVVDPAYTGLEPTLQVDRTLVRFGVVPGSVSGGTQQVSISQTGTTPLNWTATSSRSWLIVSPGSGTGPNRLSIRLNLADPGLQTVGTATGRITVSSPQALNTVAIDVSVNVAAPGATAPPFGLMETPVQNATGVVGSVGVTGWALDDIGVSSVRIYRNCLSFENPGNCGMVDGYNVVYIGNATFVTGARPDVEAAYSQYPQANRAGWGYLMLTNMLPHVPRGQMFGGQGQLTLYAFATDAEGQRVLLGRTRGDQNPTAITLANDTIAKPFGAIDTPTQGETVSGNYVNWGWALTPDADTTTGNGDVDIPNDGSTTMVIVDGAPVGRVTANLCRGTVAMAPGVYCDDDVANIFGNPSPRPLYTARAANPTKHRNLDAGRAAIAMHALDTTTLANGLHTIVWSVTDSAGRVDGIGSRYFNVLNGSGDAAPATADAAPGVARDAPAATTETTDAGIVTGRSTFDLQRPLEAIEPGLDGLRRVRIPEMGRVEFDFGAPIEAGYLAANGQRRNLPVGSQLKDGVFTWSPGLGYLGNYDLVFVRAGGSQVAVRVTVHPIDSRRARIAGYVDAPAAGTTVHGAFTIAGWAADLTAWAGSGIGAVHVWAHPRGTQATAPIFLGAAELGGERPDVAKAVGEQYGRSAWSLAAPALAPGTYDVTAYFWSARTGRFEDARTVTIGAK